MRSSTLLPFLITLGASHSGLTSKRGLGLISSTPDSDISFLTSNESAISWYYTWSPYAHPSISPDVVFFPLLHGIDAAEDSELHSILDRAPESSTHILTFNEPDHGTDDGGSDISPEDAAKAYIEYIVPLRKGKDGGRTWNISHPSVTGSGKGLDWLRDFNSSCYEMDSKNGCPTDFIAVHWYGDFAGLASHMGVLRDFYGNGTDSEDDIPPMYVTEMAFAGEDADANVAMLNESMKYLDGKDWVQGYAWFGAFRQDDANEWTGDGVSLLNDDGGLTTLGAEYLGGEENGFKEGMGGGDEDDAGVGVRPSLLLMTVFIGLVMMSELGLTLG
ncbi:hypothetical protein NLU13_9050 [Sarocladium strictum]|uniref:Asl1-like glycosyl hydrolase catalytic domain-containing protein n=1 Tax=Sarocladium strictum TaxID=5046 RepID=A0AA39G9E9_SARSR|nr:hypothetical protein NLU13_9050 [Sarocladium strictum]